MSELDKTPKATCGSVILMGLLAGLVVYALRGYLNADAPPSWGATAAAAVAVVSAFVTQRRLQNFFAGLLAAALFTAHPTWRLQSRGPGLELLAEAVVPAIAAVVAVGWGLAFHPRFTWRMWPVVALLLAGCEGLALALPGRQGFHALVLGTSGLLSGAVLAWAVRGRGKSPTRPSFFNPPSAVLATLAAVVGGLFLASAITQTSIALRHELATDKALSGEMPDLTFPAAPPLWDLLAQHLRGPYTLSLEAFVGPQASAWAWPHLYLTLPLIAYGWWRSVRRGAIQWSRKQAPLAWLLSLATLAVPAVLAVHPGTPIEQTPLLPLSLMIALTVFLGIDLVQGLLERLILRPPETSDSLPEKGTHPAAPVPTTAR